VPANQHATDEQRPAPDEPRIMDRQEGNSCWRWRT